jgi:hypothetical protein
VTVVDLWVNALTGKAAAAFMGQAGNEGIPELLGGDLSAASTLQQLLATMDACGVDVGVIAAGLAAEETSPLLDEVAAHHDRLRVALTVDRPDRPVKQVTRLRSLAGHPAVALVRARRSSTSSRSTTSSTTRSTPPAPSSACPCPSTSASPAPACARPASTPCSSRTS